MSGLIVKRNKTIKGWIGLESEWREWRVEAGWGVGGACCARMTVSLAFMHDFKVRSRRHVMRRRQQKKGLEHSVAVTFSSAQPGMMSHLPNASNPSFCLHDVSSAHLHRLPKSTIKALNSPHSHTHTSSPPTQTSPQNQPTLTLALLVYCISQF